MAVNIPKPNETKCVIGGCSINYRVLRFWNNEVMSNMDGVLQTIADALRMEAPPHPVPASSGNRPLPASGER
jgi:Protein of unknown function (DUF559)